MKILVCFAEIPENIRFCIVRDEQVLEFHNKLINEVGTSDELGGRIRDYFYDEEGEFKLKELDDNVPLGIDLQSVRLDRIVVTGQLL
jgi:hypothetical protein